MLYSLSPRYYFGFIITILFWILWEITDLFWLSLIILAIGNIVWSIYVRNENLILRRKSIKGNENDNNKLKKVEPFLTLNTLFPIGFFVREQLVNFLIFIFIFGAFQFLLGKPIKNAALSVFGETIFTKNSDTGSFIDSTEKGDRELFYLESEFFIDGKGYTVYQDFNYEIENVGEVKIDYLPINPEVNRFSDRDQSPLMDIILSIVSIILPVLFLVNQLNKLKEDDLI